jgi:hypothetical protein
MEKLYVKIFSVTLALIAIPGVATFANAQTGGGVTVAVTRGPHPAWEGKAAGDVQSFERNIDNLRTALLSQPIPDIWLEFAETSREGHLSTQPSKNEAPIKIALPPEAKSILKLFWAEALKFDYDEAFVKAQSAQEAHDRDIGWINKCAASIVKLEQVEIDAPDGKRKISDVEAEGLVYFTRRASADLVNKAKEKRKNRQVARFNPTTQQIV